MAEIELDFSAWKDGRLAGWIALALLAIVMLGLLGRTVTVSGRALTPTEWPILQENRAYRSAWTRMSRGLSDIEALLQSDPDPVRAQVIVESALSRLSDLTVLEDQHHAVEAAGQAVIAYARGVEDRATAVSAVNTARQALNQVYGTWTTTPFACPVTTMP